MNKRKLQLLFGGKKIITSILATPDDTWLQSATGADTNNSTSTAMFARLGARAIIIKFDLSSLAGKTINSAILTLTTQTAIATAANILAYQILAANTDMVFAEMTWNIKKTGSAWAGAAGCSLADTDYNSVSMGLAAYPASQDNTKMNINLDVTQFETMIANNYGIILLASVVATYAFHSQEAATESYRPILTVKHK